LFGVSCLFFTDGLEIQNQLRRAGITIVTALTLQDGYAQSDVDFVCKTLRDADARYGKQKEKSQNKSQYLFAKRFPDMSFGVQIHSNLRIWGYDSRCLLQRQVNIQQKKKTDRIKRLTTSCSNFHFYTRNYSLVDENHVWIGYNPPLPSSKNISVYGDYTQMIEEVSGYILVQMDLSSLDTSVPFRNFLFEWRDRNALSPIQ
jgi:hypothetical protein